METTENLTQENTNNSVMKQVDYLKIKVEDVKQLCTDTLIEHPRIKNRFKLESISLSDGQELYTNNIDIYHKNNTVFINTSIPYLIHGHNFIQVNSDDAHKVIECLSEALGIDIFTGKIIDFEVALLFDSNIQFKNLIKTISSVDGLELQKKDSSFVAYGKGNTQLKIYSIYKNLKSKLRKPIFDSILGLNANSLKIELKMTKDKRYTIGQFLKFGIDENISILNHLIENRINYSECNFDGTKFDDILYKALLKANKYTYKNVDEMVLDIIDTLPISYSQKAARRKSLREKQLKAQLAGKITFKDLLKEPCCEDLPF